MPVHRQPGPLRGRFLVLAFISATLGGAREGLAQVKTSGEVRTPAQGVPIRLGGNLGAGAMGSTATAAKVFNPVKIDYQVNGANANRTETANFDSIIRSAVNLVTDPNPANRPAYLNGGNVGGIQVEGLKTIIPKRTAPAAANNAFQLVNKPPAASNSQVQNLNGRNNAEFASATASQQAPANGKVASAENPVTQVDKPGKLAIALAVNRDPIAVTWSSSSHPITVDLTGLTLNAQSAPGGHAFAIYDVAASIIDGTNNVNLSESLARPVFEFLFPVFSDNGGAATLATDAMTFDTFGSVSDSQGDRGQADVETALLSHLVPVSGGLQFQGPFSITITPSGDSSQSVLFTRDFGLAGAAVPEPRSAVLLLIGGGTVFLALRRPRVTRTSQEKPLRLRGS